jgi:serine/threonine protein kinase
MVVVCAGCPQVKAGVDHMHSKGLGHCDIKPSNIFVDAAGSFFLGDYGATMKLGEEAKELTHAYVLRNSDAEAQLDEVERKASQAVDYGLLATTLMSKLCAGLPLPCTKAQLARAVDDIELEPLKAMLTSLLKAA